MSQLWSPSAVNDSQMKLFQNALQKMKKNCAVAKFLLEKWNSAVMTRDSDVFSDIEHLFCRDRTCFYSVYNYWSKKKSKDIGATIQKLAFELFGFAEVAPEHKMESWVMLMLPDPLRGHLKRVQYVMKKAERTMFLSNPSPECVSLPRLPLNIFGYHILNIRDTNIPALKTSSKSIIYNK